MFLQKINHVYFSWFGLILGIYIGGFGLYLQWTNPSYDSKTFLFNLILAISGTLIILSVYNNTQNHFITKTRKLDLYLERIFDNAKRYIIIISPYFKAGENRIRSILHARGRGVHVTIIVNSRALINKSGVEELIKLKDKGCLIKVHPDMHSNHIYSSISKSRTHPIGVWHFSN
tara:strand:- start:697 stop:1218 length:522 start_codon:yes stop_codon:yes gene_type:complete